MGFLKPEHGRIVPYKLVWEDPLAENLDGDWFCRDCGACLCQKCGHEPKCPGWGENTYHGLTFVYDPENPPEGVWDWDYAEKRWVQRP